GLTQMTALQQALGAAPGEIAMAYAAANPGETHVAAGTEGGGRVPMTTLDLALPELGIGAVDYLKIDVEGFELPVLQGAQQTIAASPGIIVQTELVARHAARYGHRLDAIGELLRRLGLSPYRPKNGTLVPHAGPLEGELLWQRG
ncbi:FkbM family methyltransferase, partial [Siccirubricoccus sp. KC 17139]